MSELEISEIEIVPVKPKNGLLAFASFVLNREFYVGNVAIFSRPDGQDYRLVYPTKVLPNGKSIACFHPITRQAGDWVKANVIAEYLGMLCGRKMGGRKA